jgi:hypothetical protein
MQYSHDRKDELDTVAAVAVSAHFHHYLKEKTDDAGVGVGADR